MRDTKSYCGVLLDDNNRKPLCRLRFNGSQKYVGFFDAQKNEEKVPIASPIDLFSFEARLVETLGYYCGSKPTREAEAEAEASEAPPDEVVEATAEVEPPCDEAAAAAEEPTPSFGLVESDGGGVGAWPSSG